MYIFFSINEINKSMGGRERGGQEAALGTLVAVGKGRRRCGEEGVGGCMKCGVRRGCQPL